jgi:hypothetical protein
VRGGPLAPNPAGRPIAGLPWPDPVAGELPTRFPRWPVRDRHAKTADNVDANAATTAPRPTRGRGRGGEVARNGSCDSKRGRAIKGVRAFAGWVTDPPEEEPERRSHAVADLAMPETLSAAARYLSGAASKARHCEDVQMPNPSHTKAADAHEIAAKSHRTAAEHHGKGDHQKGHEHSSEAQKHSEAAHKQSVEAHAKSAEHAKK